MLALLQASSEVAFSTVEAAVVIVLCAFTALISQMALAVFNDGVRPFLLDFIRGRTSRGEMTSIAFGLSAGFIFGLGAPLFFSTGILNPWLLFLPTDILGILSPRRWIAPILGAAWGVLVIYALGPLNTAAKALPVDFLGALQNIAIPILYLFTLFPAIAVASQFGRVRGAIAFFVTALALLLTVRFLPNIAFPGSIALVAGIAMLIVFALQKDLADRRAQTPEEREAAKAAAANSLFVENAERLRRNVLWFVALGALLALLVNLKIFGGGEATSFIVQKENYAAAAQLDFYRAFGFLPLIVTTALASGAYQIVGLTFVYPLGYLSPNPIVAVIGGAILFGAEIYLLAYIGRGLSLLPSLRESSDYIRNAITNTLGVAILFGSILAGNAMAEGLGIALVGGLYALNEALNRPLVRLAAGPTAVIITGILLNVLFYLDLFTPPKGG
jgi:hypothetical protein